MNYLVIDDDRNWLRDLANAGIPENCLAECHSAEETVIAIASLEPDIIFLDYFLQNDSGGDTGVDVIKKDVVKRVVYSTSKMQLSFDVIIEYLEAGAQSIE